MINFGTYIHCQPTFNLKQHYGSLIYLFLLFLLLYYCCVHNSVECFSCLRLVGRTKVSAFCFWIIFNIWRVRQTLSILHIWDGSYNNYMFTIQECYQSLLRASEPFPNRRSINMKSPISTEVCRHCLSEYVWIIINEMTTMKFKKKFSSTFWYARRTMNYDDLLSTWVFIYISRIRYNKCNFSKGLDTKYNNT